MISEQERGTGHDLVPRFSLLGFGLGLRAPNPQNLKPRPQPDALTRPIIPIAYTATNRVLASYIKFLISRYIK